MAKARTRLDALLVERGLYGSRNRAAAAIMAGEVRLGEVPGRAERRPKPGQLVAPDVAVDLARGPAYVSRGGLKLAAALHALELPVAGRLALDVGASTGGFTDCLLKRGAVAVAALDVGRGQLDWGLRGDPRVTVLEGLNARALEPSMLPFGPDLIAVDVSFISLEKVLPAVLACAAARFDCLALVKPQFEVGRERVGRGGVVRGADDRRAALLSVGEAVVAAGWSLLGFVPSGLPGPAGNRESFAWIGPAGAERAFHDVGAAARRSEP